MLNKELKKKAAIEELSKHCNPNDFNIKVGDVFTVKKNGELILQIKIIK